MSKKYLFETLSRFTENNPARFFMPGHKGGYGIGDCFLSEVMPYDVTELYDTDNLYEPTGPLLAAQEEAGAVFKAEHAFFSAGGSSQALFGALIAAVRKYGGGKIVLDRNCHRTVIDACIFLGLEPVFVQGRCVPVFNITAGIEPKSVEDALDNSGASIVFVTSPTYYGVISDIKNIAQVCRKKGACLIVDSAHGAHLGMSKAVPLGAQMLGADLVAASAHKTLPALTGGAFLFSSGKFRRDEVEEALAMAGSTSPSYLIMSSLEYAVHYMKGKGGDALDGLADMCSETMRQIKLSGVFVPLGGDFCRSQSLLADPCRIVIAVPPGISGREVYDKLYKAGVVLEMEDERNIVALPSVLNCKSDFERLINALMEIEKDISGDSNSKYKPFSLPPLPKREMTLREGFFAERERIKIKDASMRVCAEIRCVYPPGVPVLMPGEVILPEMVQAICNKDSENEIWVVK